MLTRAGDRRRTPGGTFFHLVRQQCSKQERARLFPYPAATLQHAQQPAPPARPAVTLLVLTLDLWKGLTPMPVTATLKLVLRDLPETRENGGLVYQALHNEPRGILPKGISLDSGPLYLTAPVKPWRTACTKAEQIRASGTPALLIVEAHVSTRDGASVGVVKGVQVVEVGSPAATGRIERGCVSRGGYRDAPDGQRSSFVPHAGDEGLYAATPTLSGPMATRRRVVAGVSLASAMHELGHLRLREAGDVWVVRSDGCAVQVRCTFCHRKVEAAVVPCHPMLLDYWCRPCRKQWSKRIMSRRSSTLQDNIMRWLLEDTRVCQPDPPVRPCQPR